MGIFPTLHNADVRGLLSYFIANLLSNNIIVFELDQLCPKDMFSMKEYHRAVSLTCNWLPPRTLKYATCRWLRNLLPFLLFSYLRSCEREIQMAVNKLFHWSQERGSKFSVGKSVIMHVTIWPPSGNISTGAFRASPVSKFIDSAWWILAGFFWHVNFRT